MTNISKIMKGIGIWFAGYIGIVILNYILNEAGLISLLETVYTSITGATAGLTDFIWFFVIIAWLGIGIVLPIFYIYQGLMEEDENSKTATIGTAILIFLTSIVLTIKGYYMVTALSTLSTEPIVIGIFWVGIIAIWLTITLITPFYMIYTCFEKA